MASLAVGQNEAVLVSLMEVGVNLSALQDRQTLLEMILTEARKLSRAEAGTLYICQDEVLRFTVAQNDRMSQDDIGKLLLGKEMPASGDSLAGFAASTGRMVNIPDTYKMPEGAPFRIHRDFDSATGYRVQSVLAIPLLCPDESCVGVLQLINRIGPDGQIGAFPEEECDGVKSLASMAAVTIHNLLLQEQLKESQLDCIIRLSVAAEFRDKDTAAHIHRISHASALIASAMRLHGRYVELIRHASPMHDVGKIGIPDAILLKPGPLTVEERQVVQTHTLIGADILKNPPNELLATAHDIALTHHEKFNGTGYPKGLSGEEIPLPGRIVCLADVFDALITRRCYKEAFPLNEALALIREEEGEHFDPDATAALFNQMEQVLAYYEQIH